MTSPVTTAAAIDAHIRHSHALRARAVLDALRAPGRALRRMGAALSIFG